MIIKIKKFQKDAVYIYNKNKDLFLTNYQEMILEAKTINIINTQIGIEVDTLKNIDIKLNLTSEIINKNLYMINYPPTIDKDYRGEIKLIIFNFNNYSITLNKNTALCLFIINNMQKITFKEIK